MGWVKKFDPEHSCRMPRINKRIGLGSVWRCDECGQEWIVVHGYGSYVFTRAEYAGRLREPAVR